MSRADVRLSILNCQSCELWAGCRAPVPFRGPDNTAIVVLGEAPGEQEDHQGKPFVGPSGVLAQRWLDQAGVGAENVAWLNVVSCFPHRTPSDREVSACRTNLVNQLSFLRPAYGLILGGVAAKVWHSALRIGEVRGRWFLAKFDSEDGVRGFWGLATYHPSAILRNGTLAPIAERDTQEFARVVEGWETPILNSQCVKCGSFDFYGKYLDDIAYCSKHYLQATGKAVGRASQSSTLGRRQRSPVKRSVTVNPSLPDIL